MGILGGSIFPMFQFGRVYAVRDREAVVCRKGRDVTRWQARFFFFDGRLPE